MFLAHSHFLSLSTERVYDRARWKHWQTSSTIHPWREHNNFFIRKQSRRTETKKSHNALSISIVPIHKQCCSMVQSRLWELSRFNFTGLTRYQILISTGQLTTTFETNEGANTPSTQEVSMGAKGIGLFTQISVSHSDRKQSYTISRESWNQPAYE